MKAIQTFWFHTDTSSSGTRNIGGYLSYKDEVLPKIRTVI